MKACFKCKQFKPHDAFYANSAMRDGCMGKCKECTKADVRANYRAHLDKFREYDRKRAMAPHRVAARSAYQRTQSGIEAVVRAKRKYDRSPLKKAAMQRYRGKFPSKRTAHVMCGNAIRDGRLIRQPCEVCGNAKSQAHHDDYSKPLDVRWLCTKHHAEWHRHNTPLCPEQEVAA